MRNSNSVIKKKDLAMSPIVTIIIPIYNKDKYIENTLNSIIAQTFRDYECILIDDGSTDKSGEICDSISNKDSRFKVIHINNGGVSHARNIGIERAQGEYITFIDSDDLVHPEYLNNLYNCILSGGADLVISGLKKVWANKSQEQPTIPVNCGLMNFDDVLPKFAAEQKSSGIYGWCVGKIFKRTLIENIRFDESLKLAEDFDFYLKLYEKIDTVLFDDKTYYYYLQEADNSWVVLQKDNNIDYLAQFKICIHYKQMLENRNAWFGENKNIVEGLLGSYAYFTLFHSQIENLKQKFDALYDLIESDNLEICGKSCYSKWIIYCLKHNFYSVTEVTIRIYRLLKKILKRK